MSFKLLKKPVSYLIIITFIIGTGLCPISTYASPDSRSIFKNKKVDYQKIKDQNEGVLQKKKAILSGEDADQAAYQQKEAQRILSSHLSDISQITIPSEIGRIVEVHQSTSAPEHQNRLVVHIQDLHTNPEAEYNLAKILEILLNDYKMGLVCSEGAVGGLDTKQIASFPDYAAREKVGKIFVNAGELTGEEYLAITKYPDIPIWGIETEDIYFKNIIDFNKIMKFNPQSQVFISQAKKALKELKAKIYTKELLDLDQKEADYEVQKIESIDYIKYLSGYIGKLNVSTADYKNITLLTETAETEKTIDQPKIMNESQNLFLNLQSAIAAKSSRADLDGLMANAQLFKEQKISPFSFYSYLKDLANRHLKDDFIAKYPNLNGFIDYLTKVNSLDSTKLFIELEDLNFEIKEALSKTDEQKTLVKAIRNINFLEGFFDLKVSNEELDYYLNNRDSHKVAFFESFLKPTLKKYNINTFIDYNASLIDPHLTELEEFYKVVKERDVAMVNNSLSEIEKRGSRVSSLIAGGFHTKGITKLLKEKGYSYIVVSPYSKTDIDEENYHFLLTGQRKPIEELLNQLDLKALAERFILEPVLRVPLAFNTVLIQNFNREVVSKLGDGSIKAEWIEPIADRIGFALGLETRASRLESLPFDIVFKLYKGEINIGYIHRDGRKGYFKMAKKQIEKIGERWFLSPLQEDDFIGEVAGELRSINSEGISKSDQASAVAAQQLAIPHKVDLGVSEPVSVALASNERIAGLPFIPTRDFKQGRDRDGRPLPLDMSLITPTRNAQEVIELLKEAKDRGLELSIQGHLRGVDGAGSSLDLPEFQLSLTKQGARFPTEHPSTPTIASEFSVKIRFELADDLDVIEYIAPDYRIPENEPYRIRGDVVLDDHGRTTQKNGPAFIFRNVFGLSGIRIICEPISPMALAGGMESSNVFNVALIAAASMLSGGDFSYADIFNLAVKLENDQFAGLTGGQGHIGTMTGGAYQHIWLSGVKDENGNLVNPYSAFSVPLLTTEEQFRAVENHMMLVQAGKRYVDGEAQIGRAASLTNNMWTDLLRDRDSIGLPLHQEKLGLTAQYTKALKEGDFETVVKVINRYVEIRDELCRRWLSLVIDAHNGAQGLPEYAARYASKVFDENNPDYDGYKLVRDMYFGTDGQLRLGDNLRYVTLYNLGTESLVKEAREAGIALMGLGAGGPGANLIAISVKGNEYTRIFLEKHGIKELTDEDEARAIIHGTGELKGYVPFNIGREGLQIKGFGELQGVALPGKPELKRLASNEGEAQQPVIDLARAKLTQGLEASDSDMGLQTAEVIITAPTTPLATVDLSDERSLKTAETLLAARKHVRHNI